MTPESFAHALRQLDPGSRALLDLSVHRGMGDDEIAELLGSDAGYVSSSREAAIAQLSQDLGMHGDAERVRESLAAMPAEAWRPWRDDGSAPSSPAAPPPAVHRRRRRLAALVGLLLIAAVAAIVIASSGGDSSKPSSQRASTSSPPAAPVEHGVALEPLSASSPAKGTARLDGRRLTLSVSDLPRPAGSYEVWLYDNEIDALPVTTFRSGTARVTRTLPRSPAGYRYLDISLEPADGNPNHSGHSVLRVPLRDLRRP